MVISVQYFLVLADGEGLIEPIEPPLANAYGPVICVWQYNGVLSYGARASSTSNCLIFKNFFQVTSEPHKLVIFLCVSLELFSLSFTSLSH